MPRTPRRQKQRPRLRALQSQMLNSQRLSLFARVATDSGHSPGIANRRCPVESGVSCQWPRTVNVSGALLRAARAELAYELRGSPPRQMLVDLGPVSSKRKTEEKLLDRDTVDHDAGERVSQKPVALEGLHATDFGCELARVSAQNAVRRVLRRPMASRLRGH